MLFRGKRYPDLNYFLEFCFYRFGKSTAQYASWLIVVVLVGEAAFGAGRDALWESLNAGHTYKSTDWSKFDQFGEDDDDDDDEDDDGKCCGAQFFVLVSEMPSLFPFLFPRCR